MKLTEQEELIKESLQKHGELESTSTTLRNVLKVSQNRLSQILSSMHVKGVISRRKEKKGCGLFATYVSFYKLN
jgi:DNA-binding MarR family transcriptional regulator